MLESLAQDTPTLLRVALGAFGALLWLFGARVYDWGLRLSALLAGALGALALLSAGARWFGTTLPPEVALGGAAVGGVALAGLTLLAHKVVLSAIGALVGLLVGASIGAFFPQLWWVALLGTPLGALLFPFVYRALLPILTPAVGAVALLHAAGYPGNPWIFLGVWAVGAAFQLFVGGSDTRPAKEEEE